MGRNLKKNNDGSALIVAIVAGVVVMTFSLMLLMVSYSLFSTANGQLYDMSARELSQSISEELAKEITEVQFASFEEQQARELSLDGLDQIWFYLRYNIWQPYIWPAINDDNNSSYPKYKYFKLSNQQGKIDKVEDVTVKLSWERSGSAIGRESEASNIDGTRLFMTVSVTDKGMVYETTKSFLLTTNLTDYLPKESDTADEDINLNPPTDDDNWEKDWEINGEGEDEIVKPQINLNERYKTDNKSINPNSFNIYMYEKWSWTLE